MSTKSKARFAIMIAGAVVALAGPVLAACSSSAKAEAVDHATIAIRFSKFTTKELTVPVGTPIEFTLRNDDPIEHEWIVGTADVHEQHRTGSEAVHDSRPAEVTIPALESRKTVVTFDRPGDYQFVCHLPGHEEYGMRGTIHVVRR